MLSCALVLLLAALYRAQEELPSGVTSCVADEDGLSACCGGYLYSISGIAPASRRFHNLCLLFVIVCSWWPYIDPANKYMYFFQVAGGGLAKTTVYNGTTCTLANTGYAV
jgi:hypothetical protein